MLVMDLSRIYSEYHYHILFDLKLEYIFEYIFQCGHAIKLQLLLTENNRVNM